MKTQPALDRAWTNLGVLLAEQGRVEDSLEAFKHVVSPAEAHSNVGVILTRQGRSSEAKAEFENALSTDSSLVQATVFLTHFEKERLTDSQVE